MRSASRAAGRFAPRLHSLEGRMLLSQGPSPVSYAAPVGPVLVLFDRPTQGHWAGEGFPSGGGGSFQGNWGGGFDRVPGLGAGVYSGPGGFDSWKGFQGGGWDLGYGGRSWTSFTLARPASDPMDWTSPSLFAATVAFPGLDAAPADGPGGLALTTSASPAVSGPSPPASASTSDLMAVDGPAMGRGPMGPVPFRPRGSAIALIVSAATAPTFAEPGRPGGPQMQGAFTANTATGPADPPPPAPPYGPNVAASVTPATTQAMADPGSAWTNAAAFVNVVGPHGPGISWQTPEASRNATTALVSAAASASARATIAVQAAGAADDANAADGIGSKGNPEAAAPQAAGVLTAFMPLDPGAVEASLEKLMDRIDALGEPIAATSDRLPIVIPVAVALAAMETARRRLGKTSTPGPTVGRGSRFSSLRGLS